MVAKSISKIINKHGGDCVWDRNHNFKNIEIAYREEFDYEPTIYFKERMLSTCECLELSFGEIKQYMDKHPDVKEVLCRMNENGYFFPIEPSLGLDVAIYKSIKTRKTISNNQMGKPFTDDEISLATQEEFNRYKNQTHILGFGC